MALYVHRTLIVDLEHTKWNNDQHIYLSAYMLRGCKYRICISEEACLMLLFRKMHPYYW